MGGVRRQVRAGSMITTETKETDKGMSRRTLPEHHVPGAGCWFGPFQNLQQHIYEDLQPLSDGEEEELQDGGRWRCQRRRREMRGKVN